MLSKHNKFNIDINAYNDDFIMSPKVDFVFKLIFGDEKTRMYLLLF